MIRRAVQTMRTAFQRGYAPTKDDQRGSMLLVALGILTLLSIMAVAFAMMMNLEKKATQNYVDGVKARLIAEGALERAIEERRRDVVSRLYSDRQNEYAQTDFWFPLEVTSDVVNPVDPYRPSMVGTLGRSYQDGADRYKIKVIDTQAQFNLNSSHSEVIFKAMLSSLGEAVKSYVADYNAKITAAAQAKKLEDFQDLLFPVGNPIERAEYPILTPEEKANGAISQLGVDAIWELRQAKEGQRFKTKSELLECLPRADYRLIRDFVTALSWFDPDVVETAGPTPQRALQFGQPMGQVIKSVLKAGENPTASKRAPININLAPLPVLISALAPVSGRSMYLFSGKTSGQTIDNGNALLDPSFGVNAPEEQAYVGTPFATDPGIKSRQLNAASGSVKYLVYLPPLGYEALGVNKITLHPFVLELARAIDDRRKVAPFKSFAEWDRFVEEVVPTVVGFPDPNTTRYRPTMFGATAGGSLIYELSDGTANKFFRGGNEIGDHFREWYKRAYLGMLKSNFNPNGRFSQMNPDSAVYTEVGKGNLKYLNAKFQFGVTTTGGNIDTNDIETQTNEWCFGSKGVFEIIALGEIMQGKPGQAVEIHAQEKLRTVLQIFDQLTHTTQRQFARNGQTGPGLAPGNIGKEGFPQIDGDPLINGDPTRYNIKTMPAPMDTFEPNAPIPNQPFNAAEEGVLPGVGGADLSTGYLALKTHYAADFRKNGSFIEEQYDLAFPDANAFRRPGGDGYTNRAPDTLFETRFDFYRRGRSLDIGGNLYDPSMMGAQFPPVAGVERIAQAVADVADGRFQEPTLSLRPNNNFYSNRLTSIMAAPIPEAERTSRIRNAAHWLTTSSEYGGNLEGRWFFDLLHVDGYYSSDRRRRLFRDGTPVNLGFLTYRASYREDRLIGSAPNPPISVPTADLAAQNSAAVQARKIRGTDKDWSDRGNIHATKGVVSFWYKPDFDWNILPGGAKPTPRYCGFFSSTHVAEPQLEVARPGPDQGSTNPQASALESRSFRGTQMFFTRNPDGSLRIARLYFELSGDLRGDADANVSAELTRIVNPYYNMAQRNHGQTGATMTQKLDKPYLTLEQYKAEVSKYYTIVDASISSDAIRTVANWEEPYFYPWPPQECFLPQDATQFAASPNRAQIDRQLNSANIRTSRYDSFALYNDARNRPLLDLKKGNWYLFTVAWDDGLTSKPDDRCAMWIDGQPLQTVTKARNLKGSNETYEAYDWSRPNQGPAIRAPQINPPIDPAVSTAVTRDNLADKTNKPTFVRLNQEVHMAQEDALRDQLVIGGFRRRLVSSGQGAGVFKHTSRPTDVILSANGTIDDFVVYGLDPDKVASSLTVPDLADHGERPRFFLEGRWTQRMSEFVGVYDSNKSPIRILGAYFEGYMPYTKANVGGRTISYDRTASIQVQFFKSKDGGALGNSGTTGGGGGASPAALTPAGSIKSWGPGGAKFLEASGSLADTSIPLAIDLNAEESLIYRVTLEAGTQPRGRDEKEGISTPIFDSLTVVFQLPQRRVLIKERVFD